MIFKNIMDGPWNHPRLLPYYSNGGSQENIYFLEITFPTLPGSAEEMITKSLEELSKDLIDRNK